MSLESDLKDLVRDPSRQAERAKNFIAAEQTPTFKTKAGGKVVIDKSVNYEIVSMALTVDNLAMFTSDMQEIKKLGLLAPDSISWTLYLPDLHIVTELLPSSSQFWHYFHWRRSLIGLNNIFGTDEVNWLGIYLKQGPGEESYVPDSYRLTFSSYTTDTGVRSPARCKMISFSESRRSVLMRSPGCRLSFMASGVTRFSIRLRASS